MSDLKPLSDSELEAIHQNAAEIESDLKALLVKFQALIAATEDPVLSEAESFVYDVMDIIAEFRSDLQND